MVGPVDVTVAVLLAGHAVTLVVAVHRRADAAVVNGTASLALAVIGVALWLSTPVGPALATWVALAALLHSLGMLGPYETVWWWDHLTHAVSGALAAALVYAAAIVGVGVAVGAIAVGVTVALGVFWEAIELVARAVGDRLDVEPVLVHYGWDDTAIDLVVDAGAAVAVVTLDVRLFVPLFAESPAVSYWLLVATAGVAVGGSLVLGAWLRAAGAVPPFRG